MVSETIFEAVSTDPPILSSKDNKRYQRVCLISCFIEYAAIWIHAKNGSLLQSLTYEGALLDKLCLIVLFEFGSRIRKPRK